MTGLHIDAVVIPDDQAERVDYPDDAIWLRAVGHGEIQVADYTSTDRAGPPAHSHPWDEAQIVVDGEVEFLLRDSWHGGGSGTVQLLPRGVPHSVRVCRPGTPGLCRYRSVRLMTVSPETWRDSSQQEPR